MYTFMPLLILMLNVEEKKTHTWSLRDKKINARDIIHFSCVYSTSVFMCIYAFMPVFHMHMYIYI